MNQLPLAVDKHKSGRNFTGTFLSSGFTLIELLVVIAIISLLAAL